MTKPKSISCVEMSKGNQLDKDGLMIRNRDIRNGHVLLLSPQGYGKRVLITRDKQMVTGLSECGTWFEKTCVKAAYWLRKASNLTSIRRFLKIRRVEVCYAGDFTKKQLVTKGRKITDRRLKKIQRMNKQRMRRYRSYLQDQKEKLKRKCHDS